MSKIIVNDISLYYEIHGAGEPLVFIAGFSADHQTWQFIVDAFAQKYQVILVDNRGAGQSDVPAGPYTIEQMASDIAELCKKLSISKATFIGNSMGGYITQTLAYQYPELVKAIVLSNTAINGHSCFRIYVAAQLELLKAGAPIASIVKACISWIYSINFLDQAGKLDELIQMTLSNPYPFTIEGYEAQYAALTGFDSRDWVKKINTPTLVLGSDKDIIFLPHQTKELVETIPGAQYYSFENCGHLPHFEYPEQYIDVLMHFFD